MSKTKQLIDEFSPMDFYSLYADSDYWHNEWEKINKINNKNKNEK
jgi:hypothetical protein